MLVTEWGSYANILFHSSQSISRDLSNAWLKLSFWVWITLHLFSLNFICWGSAQWHQSFGERVHLLLPIQSHIGNRARHLFFLTWAPRSEGAALQVLLSLLSSGGGNDFSMFLVLSMLLEMPARILGLLVFLFRRSWNVELCEGSNSAFTYWSGVKSRIRFENMCLWLTQSLIAQTFSFLMVRLPEPQQENSLTIGAGRWADSLFVINFKYICYFNSWRILSK